MSSLLVISKKALRKIGVKEISSMTEQGRAADRCNSAVRDVVKEVLRAHPWSFATEWKSLPRLISDPPFGYQYAYQAPQEAEKVFDVRSIDNLTYPKEDFDMVRGKIIYTDASPCFARYVVYIESDLSQAPADFIDTCAFKLAAEICIPLAKSNFLPDLMKAYRLSLDEAKLTDAAAGKERREDENIGCKFLSVRNYPGVTDAEGY
jgi:hypothetical protein